MNKDPKFELLDRLVDQAIDMSIEHVTAGGIPFTGLVADRHGNIMGVGTNKVIENHDPTAHAEVVAIRDACKKHRMPSLRGSILVASGEPCAMCYLSALWAGVSEIVFAASRHDAARAGFDYRRSYELLASDPLNWPLKVHWHQSERAIEPFDLWRKRQMR